MNGRARSVRQSSADTIVTCIVTKETSRATLRALRPTCELYALSAMVATGRATRWIMCVNANIKMNRRAIKLVDVNAVVMDWIALPWVHSQSGVSLINQKGHT